MDPSTSVEGVAKEAAVLLAQLNARDLTALTDGEVCDLVVQTHELVNLASAVHTAAVGVMDARQAYAPDGAQSAKTWVAWQTQFEADWAEARERLGELATQGDLARTAGQRRADALVEMARRSAARHPDAKEPRVLLTVLSGEATLARICELSDGTVVTPGEVLPILRWADVAPPRRTTASANAPSTTGTTTEPPDRPAPSDGLVDAALRDGEDQQADAGHDPGLEEEAIPADPRRPRRDLDVGHEAPVAQLDQDGCQQRDDDGGVEHAVIIRPAHLVPHEPFGPNLRALRWRTRSRRRWRGPR